MGEVEHEVKVTAQGKAGWGIRVFVNGEINQQSIVKRKSMIHREIVDMLRMEDKCGNISKMAARSRFRYWEKDESSRTGQIDLNKN